MYDTKLLITEEDDSPNHFQDAPASVLDDSESDIECASESEKLTGHRTLCGETGCYELTVIQKTPRSDMCIACLMLASSKRLNYTEYLTDQP